MQIGEVIRKYRKEQQITQEAMARILGVTAPAVNKWENGNSCPDIALLAPIARLLGIQTDTLLSYQEELTDQEIGRVMEGIGLSLKNGDYKQAFEQGMKKVQEYPNCNKLIIQVAHVLNGGRYILQVPDSEAREEAIMELYTRLLDSPDPDQMQAAATALFRHAIDKQEYEEAEQFLNRIPKQNDNPEKLRAELYARQGKLEKAHELCEQYLFASYQDMAWALQGISHLAIQEQDWDRAEKISEKQHALADVLEIGCYMQAASELELACEQKDKERILRILSQLVEQVGSLYHFGDSKLFRHMKFREAGMDYMIVMLKNGLEADPGFEFMREEDGFQALMEKLERMEREYRAL